MTLAQAIQQRTPDTTQDIPWTKAEILMRLEVVRFHLGWITQGLVDYGVDADMSAAINDTDAVYRHLRRTESKIYQHVLTQP